jgi:4-amino-4-deoxy-L-arabinose transferase-like glycosyltransferase
LAAIPLCLFAFLGNRFTEVNVFLWAVCLVCIVLAFWKFAGKGVSAWLAEMWGRLKGLPRKAPVLRVNVTPFLILLVFVMGVTLFFRTYRLDQVPAEMWSDHAEKLLDVNDLLNGQHKIFFERNTGREAFQFYLTAMVVQVTGLGLGFLSLKVGTMLAGLVTLFYMYRLGKQVANPWVGLIVVLLAGAAYWPNIVSRVALRYALYPLFTAPLLFYLIRGIRNSNRNDMIKAGIALGLGLHGYSTYRIVPFLVVLAFVLYFLHSQSKYKRKQAMGGFFILVLVSLVVFLPLLSYTLENPENFGGRAFSRLIPSGPTERSLLDIFAENNWKASIMFFWDNGEIWVHSIPRRPAMDPVTAVLFFIGVVLLATRYVRKRNWLDLFLLLSIPVLLLPSTLSLAFPSENPSLNRTGGAIIPAFLIAAIGMEGLGRAWFSRARSFPGKAAAVLVLALLVSSVLSRNYFLVFDQYDKSFRAGAWNTREMGQLIQEFSASVGTADTAYVVPYPYWVDTRLVGINAGNVEKDYALWPENFDTTLSDPRAKMFILKSEDLAALEKLRQIYPDATYWLHQVPDLLGKDYYIVLVPGQPGERTVPVDTQP